jgi:Do/DeqQ family serine protease
MRRRFVLLAALVALGVGGACSDRPRGGMGALSDLADGQTPEVDGLQRPDDDGRLVGSPILEDSSPGSPLGPEVMAKLGAGTALGYKTFAALFQVVSRSVVNIFTSRVVKRVTREEPGDESLSLYEQFFGSQARENLQRSLGSGFVIDTKGYIVTNHHVIAGADEIRVRLWNGREMEAKVVGRDPKTDLAVIKVRPSRYLVPVAFGDSDKVAIGEWVAAIGNPFGLSHTLTVGVVSAKGRRFKSEEGLFNLIQTDANINPGNSGGPLLNLRGEVIGVTTSIAAVGKGIAFAIASNVVREVIPHLKLKGRVVRPWLGIYHQPLTPELALSFGLKRPRGALVAGVLEGSPAARAGLAQGDIILQFDGRVLRDSDELRQVVYRAPVGRTAKLRIWRNGKEYELNLLLEPDPEEEAPPPPAPRSTPRLGLVLADATSEEGSGGVVVQAVAERSVAWEAGIRADDLILSINNVSIANLESYQQEYAKLAVSQICRLKIRRRGIEQFVAFRVPPP